jgi:hypothetical protein
MPFFSLECVNKYTADMRLAEMRLRSSAPSKLARFPLADIRHGAVQRMGAMHGGAGHGHVHAGACGGGRHPCRGAHC